MCGGLTQEQCLSLLSSEPDPKFAAPALYLKKIGEHLKTSDFGVPYENTVLGNKFVTINTSAVIAGLASPATVQVVDSFGNSVPNSITDPDTESVVTFFPGADYKYKVVGTGSGVYDFVVVKPGATSTDFFSTANLPIATSSIYTYTFDWPVIESRGQGVIVTVDQDGDGIPEKTFTSDGLLTSEEFEVAMAEHKVTICHMPPGNPTNARTISVDESSLKAHMAHGDKFGECPAVINKKT